MRRVLADARRPAGREVAAGTVGVVAPTARPRWLQALRGLAAPSGPERTRGLPTSSNGASSFHLFWDVPAGTTFRRVAVTFEVLEPPSVDRLYFWALQVDFVRPGGRRAGGGHLGLQHHPRHPGGGAINWGGYDPSGTVLSGSGSALASALDNPNTRDYRWAPRRRYRLAVDPAPGPDAKGTGEAHAAAGMHRWRGSITDTESGQTTVVRELYNHGTALTNPMVWSEVFAQCDDPSVVVRWSEPEAESDDGTIVRPRSTRVNYQKIADGGCTNTDVHLDDIGVCQTTNRDRGRRQGETVAWPKQ